MRYTNHLLIFHVMLTDIQKQGIYDSACEQHMLYHKEGTRFSPTAYAKYLQEGNRAWYAPLYAAKDMKEVRAIIRKAYADCEAND
jgi:hypothetical protein